MSFLHSEGAVPYWQARRHQNFIAKISGESFATRLDRRKRQMRLLAAGLVTVSLVTAAASTPLEAGGAPPTRAIGWREITVPAGTALPVVLDTPVGSDISRIEQPVNGHLARV